ncbi:MAG: hypothetical protein WBC91_25325 [Phototrophicaceae bacterium]
MTLQRPNSDHALSVVTSDPILSDSIQLVMRGLSGSVAKNLE